MYTPFVFHHKQETRGYALQGGALANGFSCQKVKKTFLKANAVFPLVLELGKLPSDYGFLAVVISQGGKKECTFWLVKISFNYGSLFKKMRNLKELKSNGNENL